MSRGLIILIVLLCGVLAALLFLPKLKSGSSSVQPAPVAGDVAPLPESRPPATAHADANPGVPGMASAGTTGVQRPVASPVRVTTVVTNDPSLTNLFAEGATKPLPVLEKEYLTATNRDARLDLMMDITDVPSAEAVKSLTRLFEQETDADLKVDLIDSLLGIDGYKDEKLAMLTLGVKTGLPKEVRETAIDGLIDLEDSRAMPLLNGLLNDPDPEIRESAQDAIELMQTPAQTPKLVK